MGPGRVGESIVNFQENVKIIKSLINRDKEVHKICDKRWSGKKFKKNNSEGKGSRILQTKKKRE